MNRRAITLIIVFILLAFTQLACSLSDMLDSLRLGDSNPVSQESSSLESHSDQMPAGEKDSDLGSSLPAANQNGCTSSFAGSSNIPDGSEYQAGDAVEASITLSNTGTCTWTPEYKLVMVGGDLNPASEMLSVGAEVAPGGSIIMGVEFTAPAGDGLYLSVWKMEDDRGGSFGSDKSPDAPLRIKIRVVPSGNPQPTLSPTPNSQAPGDGFTMLEGQCFDFNSGAVVDCSDSSADFKYTPDHPVFGELTRYNDTTFGENHTTEPVVTICNNDSYAPLPHFIEENRYLCFKIETIASTSYGWMKVSNFNDDGLTFDFDLIGSEGPQLTVVPNTDLLVESQGQQITLLEGECYDVWNGQKNTSCSGIFAGFLFEEVTKKSLQTSQINPNELQFSPAMSSKPSKTDCMNASYSTTPIWPIQAASYYCYQFTPGMGTYHGWLRPTSFNLGGMTFDYLTWLTTQ